MDKQISEAELLYEIAAATIKTEGICGLRGKLTKDSLLENKGKAIMKKGIKITRKEEDIKLDIFVIVNYGYKIPDIAWKAQKNISKALEEFPQIKVSAINIHINGIQFEEWRGNINE